MEASDLEYANLVKLLAPYVDKGLPESAAFLNWFLENIFRFDDVEARDAICDGNNDKGIDGIFIDDLAEEITFFQCKTRQNSLATLGDTDLKQFAGSITQFDSARKIDVILNSNANAELKKLITAKSLKTKAEKGFAVKGVFITNQIADDNANQYISSHKQIVLYDRSKIAQDFVDLDLPDGITGVFKFSCDGTPLQFQVPSKAKLFLFAALAQELVQLPGVSDGTLFAQNVRLSLGKTDVNKAIAKTLQDKKEHKNFPLFHNGITLLCDKAVFSDNRVEIENFVVVNGAQSLSAAYHERSHITSDLRILLRVIEVKSDNELARHITLRSNNQNAIKPRDLRSNHQLQLRLKAEFQHVCGGRYSLEIKRGEVNSGQVISNEEAGRLLLAFDLEEPWSCHQIYKVFDDFYTRIFGRPEVTAARIILMDELMQVIREHSPSIEHRLFATYTLTRFLILTVLAKIIKRDSVAKKFAMQPDILLNDAAALEKFKAISHGILRGIIIDVNYSNRTRSEDFDYKILLKTQTESRKFMDELTSMFDKDVARGKAETYVGSWTSKSDVG